MNLKPTAEDIRTLPLNGRNPFSARFDTLHWNETDNAWEIDVTYWDKPTEEFIAYVMHDEEIGWFLYD